MWLIKERFHLVGIKGVALTALSLMLKDLGKQVTGSDTAENFATEQALRDAQIPLSTGFSPQHIKEAEVVIYSAAHQGSANPEVLAAQAKGRLTASFPQILGEMSQSKSTVAVCGCHGKSTTTSLLSFLLLESDLDPSYLVGVADFMHRPPGRWGKGELLITEADEYLTDPVADRQPKFLHLFPRFIIATNLDFDHPDFFADIAAVKNAYQAFFARLNADGLLIVNGDDDELLKLAKLSHRPFISFGFGDHNHYRIELINHSFRLFKKKQLLVEFTPKLYGRHNAYNLAAALSFLHHYLKKINNLARLAAQFTGARRRLELIGRIGESLLIDDYGHHPTEMAAAIAALRQQFPDHKIALCFQPHTYSRTKALQPEFIKALRQADFVGLLPIFASARESVDQSISSQLLLKELSADRSLLLGQPADFGELVNRTQQISPKWIYVTMGAGTVYQNQQLIRTKLNERTITG